MVSVFSISPVLVEPLPPLQIDTFHPFQIELVLWFHIDLFPWFQSNCFFGSKIIWVLIEGNAINVAAVSVGVCPACRPAFGMSLSNTAAHSGTNLGFPAGTT